MRIALADLTDSLPSTGLLERAWSGLPPSMRSGELGALWSAVVRTKLESLSPWNDAEVLVRLGHLVKSALPAAPRGQVRARLSGLLDSNLALLDVADLMLRYRGVGSLEQEELERPTQALIELMNGETVRPGCARIAQLVHAELLRRDRKGPARKLVAAMQAAAATEQRATEQPPARKP